MKSRSLGALLLAVWLIVSGLSHILHFSFSGMGTIMSGVAVTAGVFILLGL